SVNPQSDLVTEVSPGIRVNSQGARLKGFFDYSIDKIMYAQSSSSDQYQRALNTAGTLEAIDNWAYIDFSGSIARQAISPFGTPSISNTSINSNQTEVSSYQISPYVRGRLGDAAKYEARYSRAVTSSDAGPYSDVNSSNGTANISGDTVISGLGWSADASQQNIDYSNSLPSEADRFTVGPSYAITPQLRVSANVGRELNNYTTPDKQSYPTSGFAVNWTPSPMTTLSASRELRSFGESHNVSFEHRTGRTVWKFTDSKDIFQQQGQTGVANLGSIYGLLYSQFASIEPDPTARAQLVNAFLQANGLNPNTTVVSNFLPSAVSLQRQQELSFALLGVRDTITFIATRLEISGLNGASTVANNLNSSLFSNQFGFGVNYTHRLTPDYSLGIMASQQRTSPLGLSNGQDGTLRSLNLNVSGRVGKRTTASVGFRRVVYSAAAPYNETAVFGTLIVQF
ncbi:MAG: TIGR03016 family PEP-CTERM system-associated outer membrane protein, partial [Rhodoferax sp.]